MWSKKKLSSALLSIHRLQLLCCLLVTPHVLFAIDEFRWPTENRAFAEAKPQEDYLQPTASGNLHSALFGCTRNNGYKFHEGIDLKATRWDSRREALDDIYAIAKGKIVHISKISGHSSYGRYLVIEHTDLQPAIYSLYSHLRSVENGLQVGQTVQAGQKIARMGRSASGYTIPRNRAHLHLEIGLRLTDYFQPWYDAEKFTTKNRHSIWHGFNLIGMDAYDFFQQYRDQQISSIGEYVDTLPIDFSLLISTRRVPDFIRRYPELLEKPIPDSGLVGWKIHFTWYGLPFSWTPILASQQNFQGEGMIHVLDVNRETLEQSHCRNTLHVDGSTIKAGETIKNYLQLLFAFR